MAPSPTHSFLYLRNNRTLPTRMSQQEHQILEEVTTAAYKYGFESNIITDTAPKGLNEAIIHLIARKKNEPDWMLAWRLKAYRHWLTMQAPQWANVHYAPIDYQNI